MGIRNISLVRGLCFLLICLFVQVSRAEKTLFSIDSHSSPVAVRAYEIEGNAIKNPVTISEDLFGYGPVGAAVSEKLGLLFVTYEAADIVPVFRCRTLLKVADVDTNVLNLAGIAADDSKDKIYILQRNTRLLYVYTWNEITETLDFESQEDLVGLPIPYNGTGIALDGGYLYVTDTSDTVRCFDTTNWDHQSDKDITLPQGNNAWAIAIYHQHNLLDIRYGYFGGFTSHNNLIRVNLDNPNDYIIVTPSEISGEGVNGISVNPDTGLVYASVDDGTNRVFNTSLTELYSIDTNVSGPAGMAVGNRFYSPFKIEKSDDVDDNDCVSPQMGEITYTLCYDYQWDEESDPDPCEFDSLTIVDYLPQGVDFVSASDSGSYDSDTQTVTWTISLDPFDPNCVELLVRTNKSVIPGGEITNKAEISTTLTIDSKELDYSDSYEIDTSVCDCSEYGWIIHVDADVNVQDPNGATWDLAFNNLQDALSITWPCDEVWVADGSYKPTTNPNNKKASFGMINKVGVYGGFSGNEEQRWQRNWFDNETVLDGFIDAVGSEPNNVDYVVVSDANAPVSALDGFTITGGALAGISCEISSPIIQHNKITDNPIGIYCIESDQPVIKNNWIYRNDCGMYFYQASDAALIRNNTVVYNDEAGIILDPGIKPKPFVTNCILWGNGDESIENQLNWDYTKGDYLLKYSCIQDSNDITTQPPYYTINTYPIFIDPNQVNPADDNYLLKAYSPCIDAGDPNGNYSGERDIDKHFRALDGNGDDEKRVDMGADEYCNQGTDNVADFNEDDIVDTDDLVEMASAWLIDNSDPCWATKYDDYDLSDDGMIDYVDFAYFAKEWHWMTCEKMQGYEMMEMMMGMGGGMDKMAGAESMPALSGVEGLKAETAAQASMTPSEPSIEEQIEMVKECLDFWYRQDVKEATEDEAWLRVVTSLEEMSEELQDSLEASY